MSSSVHMCLQVQSHAGRKTVQSQPVSGLVDEPVGGAMVKWMSQWVGQWLGR